MSEFEKKALSNIPPEILSAVFKNDPVDVEGFTTPLEAIMKERKKMIEPPKQAIPEIPQQKQFTPRAVDGFVLNVPHDPYQAGILLFSYLLAKVWSKDPKVAKVLKQFKFQMADANGEIIYPIEKKKK